MYGTQEILRDVFTLDKDDGYAIQLTVWSNKLDDKGELVMEKNHMLQTEDFNDTNLDKTTNDLIHFLDQYRKMPMGEGIAQRSREIEAEILGLQNAKKDEEAAVTKQVL